MSALPGPGLPRRIATLAVHTSPLDQPGTGDAGGMNVYMLEVAKRLANHGVETEIFTRATSRHAPACVKIADGVRVRHIVAGPFEGLAKQDLPAQLCAFTAGLLRAEADRPPGWYDLIQSHYWLAGQAGWLAADRWGVPLVHTAHTLGKVKNAALANGDTPEPQSRLIGEEQVVTEADRLIANTPQEARSLIDLYNASPQQVSVVPPGVDLTRFAPTNLAGRRAARAHFDLPLEGPIILFVGRIQPLKAPDVVLRALAELHKYSPELAEKATVVVAGGLSGSGLAHPNYLGGLAEWLDVAKQTRFLPALAPAELAQLYHVADVLCVPSYNESFGLVAMEAQASGVPVLAANVGGLATAVAGGVLIDGHDPSTWAHALDDLLRSPAQRATLAALGVAHAREFSWDQTAAGLLTAYRDTLSERRAAQREPVALASAL